MKTPKSGENMGANNNLDVLVKSISVLQELFGNSRLMNTSRMEFYVQIGMTFRLLIVL